MQTYTIQVTGVSEEIFRRLDQWARQRGSDMDQLVREIIKEKVQDADKPKAEMTFAEIFAPLQQDFEASGMTDDELGEFLDAEIKAHRAEKQAKAS